MKRHSSILLCLIFLLLQSNLTAATSEDSIPRVHTAGIQSGLYVLASVDELYSPYNFSGKSIFYGAFWDIQKKNYKHSLKVVYTRPDRFPKSVNLNPDFFAPDDFLCVKKSFVFEVHDHYRFRINTSATGPLGKWVAGAWVTTANITTNAYGLPELVQSSIEGGICADYRIKHHSFSAEASIPLAAWALRNCYSLSMTQNYEEIDRWAFVKRNSRFQLPNTLQGFSLSAGYRWQCNKHMVVTADYLFRYGINRLPRPLRSVTGIYSLGAGYSF